MTAPAPDLAANDVHLPISAARHLLGVVPSARSERWCGGARAPVAETHRRSLRDLDRKKWASSGAVAMAFFQTASAKVQARTASVEAGAMRLVARASASAVADRARKRASAIDEATPFVEPRLQFAPAVRLGGEAA